MVDINKILEECKLKFPIGTTINCAFGNTKNTVITDYRISTNRGIYTKMNTWIFLDGKYAEIISTPELQLINDLSIW